MNKIKTYNTNSTKGFSLIELLIAGTIGLFILTASYYLYSGSLHLFSNVKTISDNVQTKIPSMELIARHVDRWGSGVYATGSGTNCSTYPPSNTKCVTKTSQTGLATGITCDEVIFWGNLYGMSFTHSISGGTATVTSCRLSTSSGQNCYYLWRTNTLQNDIPSGTPDILGLTALSANNADCSTFASGGNATASSTLSSYTNTSYNKVLQGGDIIQRAPHKIRLYCASNSNDSNRNWLYVDLTDTASACSSNENASAIAPVDSFQATLLPAGCTASSGGCSAIQVDVKFRSQSQKYDRTYDTHQVRRVLGR
jgi:hypothetical protein